LKTEAAAMTIEIHRPELEALLMERMKAGAFQNVEDVIMQALETAPVPEPQQAASRPRRHISEIIRENMSRVPAEIMATMPTDGASQHDHYIYGWPKRDV
jgi:hypothetical protein